MPTKRQKEKAERNAQRFIRLILKGWRVESVEELPEAARIDPEEIMMGVDERRHFRNGRSSSA